MAKKTNSIGAGKTTISTSVSKTLKGALEKLATESGMKFSDYIRAIYEEAAKDGIVFERLTKKVKRPLLGVPQVRHPPLPP